jgi:hypothetical protein
VLKRQAEHAGNPQLEMLTRAEGYAFHAKLEKLPTRPGTTALAAAAWLARLMTRLG